MSPVSRAESYAFSPYAIPCLAVGLLLVAMGLNVFRRERGTRAGAAFFALTLAGGMWQLSYVAIFCSRTEAAAFFWVRVEHLAVVFIPSIFLILAQILTGRFLHQRSLAYASLGMSAGFGLAALRPGIRFLTGVYHYRWGFYARYGIASLPFLAFFVLLMAFSLALYWRKYREVVRSRQKRRFRVLLTAFALACFGSIDYFACFGVPVYPAGYVPVLLFLALTQWAVSRYKLVDITPAFAAEQILQTLADALLVLDEDGVIQVANRAACHILKKYRSELIGTAAAAVVPSLLFRDLRGFRDDSIREDEIVIESEVAGRSVLNLALSVIRDETGAPVAYVCIAKDITRFRVSEEKIRQSEERIRQILETSNDAFVSFDELGRIVEWNRHSEALFGLPRARALGRIFEDISLAAESRALFREKLARIAAPGTPESERSFEMTFVKKDGPAFPAEVTLWPIRSPAGLFFNAFLRDVSERKKTEESLARKNMFVLLLQVIAIASNQAASIEEAIQLCLDEVCIHAGWPVGHAFARDEADPDRMLPMPIWHVRDERFGRFRSRAEGRAFRKGEGVMGRVFETGRPFWVADLADEKQFMRSSAAAESGLRSGFWVPVLVGRDIVAVLEFFHDRRSEPDEPLLEVMAHVCAQIGRVAERKRAEELLRRAYDELEERVRARTTELSNAKENLERLAADLARSNQELEQFAYVASHDLQEPLRMVASYTQLLQRRYQGKMGPDADDFIAFASEGAMRAQKLIEDLLQYSRVGTRGKPFGTVDTEKSLAQALANLKVALDEAGAEVSHDPLPQVQADEVQIGQLFQNLVSNAVKFRGDSPPRIHVSARKENGHCLFSVRDNGIGIEPQYAERIFVIFQRLHTRQKYPGTGIGLAVCKKIVERHGGKIWVESRPGDGSVFYFTLPGAHAGAEEAA